jgi:hypothetical protein
MKLSPKTTSIRNSVLQILHDLASDGIEVFTSYDIKNRISEYKDVNNIPADINNAVSFYKASGVISVVGSTTSARGRKLTKYSIVKLSEVKTNTSETPIDPFRELEAAVRNFTR